MGLVPGGNSPEDDRHESVRQGVCVVARTLKTVAEVGMRVRDLAAVTTKDDKAGDADEEERAKLDDSKTINNPERPVGAKNGD